MNDYENTGYTGLASLEKCMDILKVDERDTTFMTFLMLAASYDIGAYCMRTLHYMKRHEIIEFAGTRAQALKEYPVRNVLSVKAQNERQQFTRDVAFGVRPFPENAPEDVPYILHVEKPCRAVMVEYMAGYMPHEIPLSVNVACIEYVGWLYARHRENKIGRVGSNRKDGERLEHTMPEYVKEMLTRWRRKVI